MFCIVERFKRIYPIRVVHSAHSMCFRARAWSFYDFYGNTTQVRNIHGNDGITILSFIVDINFTHWIAAVFGSQFFFSSRPSTRLLFLLFVFMSIITTLVCCVLAYVRQNTQQSNQQKHIFPRWACAYLFFESVSFLLIHMFLMIIFFCKFFICFPL